MAIEACAKCGALINQERDAFINDPGKGLLCTMCYEPRNSARQTPTPWVAEPEELSDGRGIVICSLTGDAILATITPLDRRVDAVDWANARFIVHAANAHEDLVEALDNVSAALETMMVHFGSRLCPEDRKRKNSLIETARAVLKKATA